MPEGGGGEWGRGANGKTRHFWPEFLRDCLRFGEVCVSCPGGRGGGLWPERRRKELLLKPQVDNPGLKKGGAIFYPLFTIF